VTEFWKINFIGVPETIRIFDFTTILLASQKHILNISTLFLVIQRIFTVLELQCINEQKNKIFQADFQN